MSAPRNKLIRARLRLGLKRVHFAKLVGVSPGYVTYIENGRRNPSFPVMERWLKALPEAKREWFYPVVDPRAPWPNTAELLCLDGKA